MYLFCDLVEFDTILNGTTAQKNGGEQYNIWEESHWSYWGQSYDLSASCSSNDDDDHIYKMTVQSQKFSCRFFEETVIGKKLQYNFPNDGEGQGGKGIFGKFAKSHPIWSSIRQHSFCQALYSRPTMLFYLQDYILFAK